MKKVLLVFLFLSFGISYSQTLPHVKNDTLITSTSYKIYAGLDLKIGTGSMNDGDFKFIRRNAASLLIITLLQVTRGWLIRLTLLAEVIPV
ncbi:hypothetical protein EVD20_21285 [Elizabethkingia bruuniana]|nr:hypothetical protein [Elizabethkingia bruuniana]QDZ64487.1 hypothetical protein EVD20_21285 [Elizabethkingia bruuniana]